MPNSEHMGDGESSEIPIPEPFCETDDDVEKEEPIVKTGRILTLRGILLAIVLNVLYTIINAYLGINFGFGLGFGIITVLTAYTVFHVIRGGTSRQEITTTMVASTGFVVYWTITVAIYVQAYGFAVLPWWLIPSQNVLLFGSPLDPQWIAPIIFHLGFVLISTLLGFIAALAVVDYVHSRKQAKFPFYLASGVTINTCLETGQRSRFMFWWLAMGIMITVIQYFVNVLLLPFGLSAVDWDFTPFLPAGFALGFMLNISLMAISFIIDPKISITMLFAGIVTYLVMSPILVFYGAVPIGATGWEMYFNLLFNFTLSPAIGIMILSGLIVFAIAKLRARRKSEEEKQAAPDSESDKAVGFYDYLKTYVMGLARNSRYGLSYLALIIVFIVIMILLNIFSPLPFWIGILLTLILLFPIAIIDTYVLIKFVGEAGIGMGAQRLAFYEIPLAAIGLEGYVPFMAYSAINPWTLTDTVGNLKIGVMTETPRHSMLTAQMLKIIPGVITSIIFVLAAWYFIGFPTPTFPAAGVLQGFAIVSIFALRTAGTGFNLVTFTLGGIIVGLLAAFTPIAPLGIALAMFLPPAYFIPFSFGGFLRIYADRKYGKEWFAKRGQIIAVGFIAGAAITQVIVAFLSPSLQLFVLPICVVILFVILCRYRRDPSPQSTEQDSS